MIYSLDWWRCHRWPLPRCLLAMQHRLLHGQRLAAHAPVANRTEVWTAFKAEFSLDIDTFLKEDALEQRILVSKHQTLVSRRAVALLQVGQGLLMLLDGRLKLFDVLRSSFPKCRLCLAVPLLSFL